jgi:hypothetical protein
MKPGRHCPEQDFNSRRVLNVQLRVHVLYICHTNKSDKFQQYTFGAF